MALSIPERNPDRLFAAVGHAISRWEFVELELARLYSVFQKLPYQLDTIAEFGAKGGITRDRIKVLKEAGARYFRAKLSDQEGEFALRNLTAELEKVTLARHQIAHGAIWMVLTNYDTPKPGEWITPEPGYLITAPWYSVERLRGEGDAYGYNAADIDAHAARFAEIQQQAATLANRLAPQS
jgi:aminoglycoside phosphotransferase (APT) family kinase protein